MANHIILGIQFLLTERLTAGETQLVVSLLKLGIEGDPAVEYETVTIPMVTTALLEITQDSPLELLDIGETGVEHHR